MVQGGQGTIDMSLAFWQVRKHLKSNVRFKRADAVRKRARVLYQRLIDRTANTAKPLEMDNLLKGDIQDYMQWRSRHTCHSSWILSHTTFVISARCCAAWIRAVSASAGCSSMSSTLLCQQLPQRAYQGFFWGYTCGVMMDCSDGNVFVSTLCTFCWYCYQFKHALQTSSSGTDHMGSVTRESLRQ